MMRHFFLSLVFASLAIPANANWELLKEKADDGSILIVAEKIGEGGGFIRLVCAQGEFHIELVMPTGAQAADTAFLFQVDSKPERLVAGFIDKIDRQTSVFVGLDRRGKPSTATKRLINEIAAGSELYLGDPDRGEGVDRWSLSGSSSAIKSTKSNCR